MVIAGTFLPFSSSEVVWFRLCQIVSSKNMVVSIWFEYCDISDFFDIGEPWIKHLKKNFTNAMVYVLTLSQHLMLETAMRQENKGSDLMFLTI